MICFYPNSDRTFLFRFKEPSGFYTTLSLNIREYPFLQPHTQKLCVRPRLSGCLQLHRLFYLQPRTFFSTTDWFLFLQLHSLSLSSALRITLPYTFKFLGVAKNFEKRLLASLCLSFRLVGPSAWIISAATGRIYVKFDIWVFFEKLSGKFKFHENVTKIMSTSHEDLCTFMSISGSVLLTDRHTPDKFVEKIRIYVLYSVFMVP